MYNIKELENKLNKGEELSNDEYAIIIKRRLYLLKEKIDEINDTDIDWIIEDLSEELSLFEENDEYEEICGAFNYFVSTFVQTKLNYKEILDGGMSALKIPSRLNTLNFVRQSDESEVYSDLVGELYDLIVGESEEDEDDFSMIGISSYDSEEEEEDIEIDLEGISEKIGDIENSKNKILRLGKNYFK